MPFKDPVKRRKYMREYIKSYIRNNETYAEKRSIYIKNYYEKNKEKYKVLSYIYRKINKLKIKDRYIKWTFENRSKLAAKSRMRRVLQLKAFPNWADKELIEDIYMEAQYQGLQVDHIVPLQGKTVCGLHWEGNLQLLTLLENSIKGNRH